MKAIVVKGLLTTAGLALLVFTQGCKTVARENIISSIETGIGVTLAENPKTEMYEAKVGYIRSQFYSVPTGKIVENEKADAASKGSKQDMRTNRADMTPQVVSGIRMHSGVEHLFIGMDVSENFAVGSVAVMSPAAVAMYIADAKNKDTANAASAAAVASNSMDALSSKLAEETDIVSKFSGLTADQKVQLYKWADTEFPDESRGKLAQSNSDNQFKLGFLPKLSKKQLEKVKTKLNSL